MMIMMNWMRNDHGGFTAFQIRVNREQLVRFIQGQLVTHTQRIYCHEQEALAIYRALAAHTNNALHRDLFLRLVETEQQQLNRRRNLLIRLNATIPCDCKRLISRFWRQVLVQCGPRWALAWIKWMKRHDVRRQLELARLLSDLNV